MKRPMHLRFALAAFFMGLAMQQPARAETLAERYETLAPNITITRPEGDGPFSVAILLHGCGGRRPFLDDYAQAVVQAGSAAVIVDSLTPRGITRFIAMSQVCTAVRLRGRERAGDLYAVMDHVRRQSWADPDRILVAGWSHGGWTMLDALALRSGEEMRRATGLEDLAEEPLAGIAGALFVYPYAGRASTAGRRPWRVSPDSIAIIAGDDYVVGAQYPREALERQRARGANIDIRIFPKATHAFDEPDTHDIRMRYSPDDTRRTRDLLVELVGRVQASPTELQTQR